VGISVSSGTDIAMEATKVVLMRADLSLIVILFHLSRTVFRRIKLNLFWALGYNTLGIPVAAGVLYPWLQLRLPPELAALAMALSSVSVICSSLLLKLYIPPEIRDKSIYTRCCECIECTCPPRNSKRYFPLQSRDVIEESLDNEERKTTGSNKGCCSGDADRCCEQKCPCQMRDMPLKSTQLPLLSKKE